jgi:hypothetical protein
VSFEPFELSSRCLVDAWNDKIVWWLRLWSGSIQRKMGSILMTRFVLYRVSDFDLVLAVNPVQKVESTIFFPLQRLLRTNKLNAHFKWRRKWPWVLVFFESCCIYESSTCFITTHFLYSCNAV